MTEHFPQSKPGNLQDELFQKLFYVGPVMRRAASPHRVQLWVELDYLVLFRCQSPNAAPVGSAITLNQP